MRRWLAFAMIAMAARSGAQTAGDGIARYRAMLADDNPAELWEARGEALWTTPRGPAHATLERCDLGRGPGVVQGAFVQLPRYFADTGRVQDLESRLLTCLQVLQGFDAAAIAATPFGQGEQVTLEGLVAWIAAASRGQPFALPQSHPMERAMFDAGRRLFHFRAGPYDFACASCHAQAGRRIRLQDLPDLTQARGAGDGFGAWPAYRVSTGELWSMQRRLADCFRQQRFPAPVFASDATIALGVYLGVTARGEPAAAPGLKR